MVPKAINAEAKAGLRSSTMVRGLDIRYSRDYCLFNSIVSKMQTQKLSVKDFFRPKELKAKDPKSASPYTNIAELLEQKRKIEKIKRREPGKSGPRPLSTTLLTSQKRRSMMLIRSRILIAVKKNTMLATASSQKTSVGLDNLCVDIKWSTYDRKY